MFSLFPWDESWILVAILAPVFADKWRLIAIYPSWEVPQGSQGVALAFVDNA